MSTRSLLLLVAGVAGAELAARGYLGAQPLLFHAGLWLLAGAGIALALLAGSRGRRGLAVTVAGLAAGLTLLSAVELAAAGPEPAPVAPGWSYRATGGDAAAFAAWAERHPPRPGTRGGSPRAPQGDRYQIVVIGGPGPDAAIPGGAGPWAAVLAAALRGELRCEVPVEVSQAGRPGQSLRESAERFEADVLPLEPDLVLAYHHPFGDLGIDLPRRATAAAPRIPARGALLLGGLERRVRYGATEARWRKALADDPAGDLGDTRAALFYGAIVRRARNAGADVGLASFNLPVDTHSPEAAIRFYEGAYPKLRRWILANQRHDRLVRGMAGAWRTTFVDTSDGLSGAYEDAFFDPLRLTPTGGERLARNVLAGLRELLARRPRPACAPRAG